MERCPKCDDTGFLVDEETRRAYPCTCRPRRIARRRSASLAARLPKRFREVSFEREPLVSIERANPHQVRAVRAYVNAIGDNLDQGRGIWFTGDVGTGKTTLAMLISMAALEAGRTVAIYSLPKLLARIRRTYDSEPGGDSYLSFFERLTSVDLLHIDDLGAEKRSDWVLEQLYALVNERYEAQRSVVITTNLPHPQLEEQIGSRTVSRLTQMCDEVEVLGEDRRYGKYGQAA